MSTLKYNMLRLLKTKRIDEYLKNGKFLMVDYQNSAE